MNKEELAVAIATKAGISQKDAKAAIDAFKETVIEELKKDGKVQLVGFGTFDVSKRAARQGINPRTKETIEIPASKTPRFKAGTPFKNSIN